MADAVAFAMADGVARIALSRPERLNAFNPVMHAELRDAFDTIEGIPGIRAVILTGTGRAFSSGQDLADRRAMLDQGEIDLGLLLDRDYNPLVRRIAALPVPVIAAVNGIAAGAAAAIAIGCDITIAARSASFHFPFARVGLGVDAGTSWYLPGLIGMQRAMALALTGGSIDAETAAAWGLIWRVVDDVDLDREADALARTFAAGSRGALAAIKARLRGAAMLGLDAALEAERNSQAERGRDLDYREAILAFAEKRAPDFGA